MEYQLVSKSNQLKVKELQKGDYFRFLENNDSINSDNTSIYLVVECGDHNDNSEILACVDLDQKYYFSLIDDLDKNVVKLKPIKIENDIMYFEEI